MLRTTATKSAPPWRREFIAQSRSMQALLNQLERVAPTPLPVLIVGETGTGKEVIAKAIHEASGLPGPLIAVNCATLPETLAESELFGHFRGAFSGAVSDKLGLLEAAEGGSVFFDEIGELPAFIQPKLLRVLESRTLRRVGGTRETPISCRVLAATHRDLESSVAAGLFREDLYHRLNGLTLSIPPLRDRLEDFPHLLEHFLKEVVVAGREMPLIHAEVIKDLQDFPWRGNVRELRQAVHRAVILGGQRLRLRDFLPQTLPRESADALGPWLAGKRWREIERAILIWHLVQAKSLREAARRLGIPKSTLSDRVRALKIPVIWSTAQREYVVDCGQAATSAGQ